MEELNTCIKSMKVGKAAGMDDICMEQIKNFGPRARESILKLFKQCASSCNIPKIWRQARVVALLKPGKDTSDPKNFRPISLLCHLHKLYERLILNHLTPIIEEHLIPEKAGFRPGKSCTGQILNITQHIEDGFERGQVTGAVLVDLSAAYDIVNHRILLTKI